jgi:uncharacterized protein (DUF58 family)
MTTQTPLPVREIHYRLGGPASSNWPGAHRSHGGDGGFEFRGHARLQDAPDARRLDIHASLRDPFGNWIVRRHSQRQAIAVAIVADLSASIGFEGVQRKLDVLADFTESLAQSAWRHGDSFSFVGCDDRVCSKLCLPASRRRGVGAELALALRVLVPQGRSAQALRDAHRHLPRRRGLVFLVSDFHLPLAELGAVLTSLASHAVVPVVLWQTAEFALGAERGLAQVVDPETGARRWLWWRPALRARWLAAQSVRREALCQVFQAARLSPLFIDGAFDADAVTRHFVA